MVGWLWALCCFRRVAEQCPWGGQGASPGWLPRVWVRSLFGPSLCLEQLFFKCPFYFSPLFLTTHLLKLVYSMYLTLSTCRVSQARSWGLGTQR